MRYDGLIKLRRIWSSEGTDNSVRLTVLNRPICLPRSTERKRFEIKRIGRFQRVYLVQSVHAVHSREVNAARAS